MAKTKSYIDVKAKLVNQLLFEKDLLTLSNLKSALYDFLVPSDLTRSYTEEELDMGIKIDGFIFWNEDKMVELPSFLDIRLDVPFQIQLYKTLLAKLKKKRYTIDMNSINNLHLSLFKMVS